MCIDLSSCSVFVLLLSLDVKFMYSSQKNTEHCNTHCSVSPYLCSECTGFHHWDVNGEIYSHFISDTYSLQFIVLDCEMFLCLYVLTHREGSLSQQWRTVMARGYKHVKCLLYLLFSSFNQNLKVWTHYSKNPKYEIWQKLIQWESVCSVQVKRQTLWS